MSEHAKSYDELLSECEELRRQVGELEAADRENRDLRRQLNRLLIHKHAVEAIQRERARAQQYLDVAGVLLVELDRDGTITLLNRKGHEVLEYADGELLGENWFLTCVPSAERDDVARVFRRLMAGEGEFPEQYENAVQTRTGKRRLIAWHNALLTDEHGQRIGALSSGADITERRQAEESLRAAQDFSERLIAAMQDGFSAVDVRGVHLRVNDALCQMTGFTRDELIGGGVPHPYWPPECRAEIEQAFRAVQHGQFQPLELMFVRKTGERFPVIVSPSCVKDEHGHVISYLATVKDITDRKQAELAVRQSLDLLAQGAEQRIAELVQANTQLSRELVKRQDADEQLGLFRRFAELSGQGFGITQLDGRIRYANPTLCRLLGADQQAEIEGTYLWEYGAPEHDAFFREGFLVALLRDGRRVAEGTLVSRAGVATPILGTSFLLRHEAGQPTCIVTVMTDISERKAAEQALRRQHEELQVIYDGMVDGLLIADAETHRFLRANPAICAMLGYREEELLQLAIPDIHPAEAVAGELQAFAAQLLSSSGGKRENVPMRARDGHVFYADIVGRVITYHDRRCVIGFLRDVTARRETVETLERNRQWLRRLLAANDDERRLIAYEIHNGLAQFLAAANMNFEAYEQQKQRRSGSAAETYAIGRRMLQEALQESRRLVGDLRPLLVDERGIVPAIEEYLKGRRLQSDMEFEFRHELTSPQLPAAVEKGLVRILQEGVNNAQRHSRSPKVRIELTQQGAWLRLLIQDWGVGFRPESVPPDRFGVEGIRARARVLGGIASIDSAPGQGTRLTVELPLQPPTDATADGGGPPG